jgi:DNA-binding MarR family transcriptional regulator
MVGVKRIDFILGNLANNKINITSIRAVIKLYVIAEEKAGSASHSGLAVLLGMTSAAITSVVDTIESHGYAVRFGKTNDRRTSLIRLTPLGREVAEWMVKELHSEGLSIQAAAPPPSTAQPVDFPSIG